MRERGYEFKRDGRMLRAELVVTGFPLGNMEERKPRWMVFDNREGRHWLLPGDASARDTVEEVRRRFESHLGQGTAGPQ